VGGAVGRLDDLYARVDALAARRLGGAADARIAAMGAAERLTRLTALRPTWEDPAHLPFPGGWLREGPAAETTLRRTLTAAGPAWSVQWPSGYEVATDEIRAQYDGILENRTAHARWFGDPAVRGPVVVVLHGYRGGGAPEPALWPIRRWRRAGRNVVLPVLPFHGPRAPVSNRPAFPAPDPRFTNEGFRQAVWDLTALVAWLRAEGHGPVHLAGMSLGGYTAALLGTLVDELASLLLVVPLGSLALFAHQHGRFGTGGTAEALRDALEAVYRPTSPLSRPPRLSPDRVQVVATRSDGITGLRHAELLASHFGVDPRVVRGSHLLQHHLPWAELAS
jgi:hypothetical protein